MDVTDAARNYSKGDSEIRMELAFSQSRYRNNAFLVTKADGCNKDMASAKAIA